ncbi:MAG: C40 family peptidase [Oscillospiraceae bacterium]|nr:C40 family peptidase [Oscillospiraceae bacterium]
MDKKIKTEALLAMAEAYFFRGEWLQYDQLSMDRVVTISPRRESFAPPEAASPSRRLHLDCSSFVWALYYSTFGYMLEADLTWQMTKQLRPEVFYYEPTHQETSNCIAELKNRILELLEPGDVITYFRTTGTGHTMLYLGNGSIINCSGYGVMSDYDYRKYHSNYKKGHGAIYVEDLKTLLDGANANDTIAMGKGGPIRLAPNYRNYLFADEIHRFSIHRPLELVSNPLPDALKRIKETRGLVCTAEPELPAGHTAGIGDPVRYNVIISNESDISDRSVEVCFNGEKKRYSVNAHESVTAEFVLSGSDDEILSPHVMVNGMHIFCREIHRGRILTAKEASQVCIAVTKAVKESAGVETAAVAAIEVYGKLGAKLYGDCRAIMTRLFFRHDSLNGDVLSRRPADPHTDGAAFGLYGGKGVISPLSGFSWIDRTRDLRLSALMPGDIIITSDDALFNSCKSFCYTGKSLTGVFGSSGKPEERTGEAEEQFIDSLFGSFVFAVLRPSLTMN